MCVSLHYRPFCEPDTQTIVHTRREREERRWLKLATRQTFQRTPASPTRAHDPANSRFGRRHNMYVRVQNVVTGRVSAKSGTVSRTRRLSSAAEDYYLNFTAAVCRLLKDREGMSAGGGGGGGDGEFLFRLIVSPRLPQTQRGPWLVVESSTSVGDFEPTPRPSLSLLSSKTSALRAASPA